MKRRRVAVLSVVGVLLAISLVVAARAESPPEETQEPSASPGYVVILADGSMIPSKSKPLGAFGSFRFVDPSGRTRVMPVSKVDLEATRAANDDVPDDPSRGTLSVAGGPSNDPQPLVEDDQEKADEKPATKSITVYSATWCGYCKDLNRYLAARKIPATIIEVDRLPQGEQGAARSKMQRMTGRVSYPTVIIDGAAKAGFSKSWIESKLGR
jgi:mycoredoxin